MRRVLILAVVLLSGCVGITPSSSTSSGLHSLCPAPEGGQVHANFAEAYPDTNQTRGVVVLDSQLPNQAPSIEVYAGRERAFPLRSIEAGEYGVRLAGNQVFIHALVSVVHGGHPTLYMNPRLTVNITEELAMGHYALNVCIDQVRYGSNSIENEGYEVFTASFDAA